MKERPLNTILGVYMIAWENTSLNRRAGDILMSALWIARRILSAQRKLNIIVPNYYLLEVTAKNKPVFLYCCVQLGASHIGQKG